MEVGILSGYIFFFVWEKNGWRRVRVVLGERFFMFRFEESFVLILFIY